MVGARRRSWRSPFCDRWVCSLRVLRFRGEQEGRNERDGCQREGEPERGAEGVGDRGGGVVRVVACERGRLADVAVEAVDVGSDRALEDDCEKGGAERGRDALDD